MLELCIHSRPCFHSNFSWEKFSNSWLLASATDLAEYEARSKGLLPHWLKLKFLSQDDHCDAMYAQIGAIDSFSNCVHLVLGPACDYCVGEWSIPNGVPQCLDCSGLCSRKKSIAFCWLTWGSVYGSEIFINQIIIEVLMLFFIIFQ